VPIPQGSIIQLQLPKSSYNLNLSALQSSATPSSASETPNYYQLQFLASCTQTSPLCLLANFTYSFSVVVNNNLYLELLQLALNVQVLYGGNGISEVGVLSVPPHIALAVGTPSISRSNLKAN
jgi:hypothetical protein